MSRRLLPSKARQFIISGYLGAMRQLRRNSTPIGEERDAPDRIRLRILSIAILEKRGIILTSSRRRMVSVSSNFALAVPRHNYDFWQLKIIFSGPLIC